jgi:spermidine/putrescine transport system permease protein
VSLPGGAILEEVSGEMAGATGPPAGSTSARSVRRFGGAGDILLKLVAALVLVYLFAPIFVIALFSFNQPKGRFNLAWNQFSLDAWLHPFAYPELTKALATSLEVAFVSTTIAVIMGSLMAIALVRSRFAGQKAMDTFLVLPLTAAEVVMGASLLTLFLDLGWNRGFGTIVLAHIGFQLSFVAMTVRARVRGFDWTVEDAAMDLGADPRRTFLRVTLPLIMPGIVAAAMLSFALSLDDFIITYFNAGATSTYPLYVNAAVKNGLPPQVNVLATAILVISVLLIVAGSLWNRRRAGAQA